MARTTRSKLCKSVEIIIEDMPEKMYTIANLDKILSFTTTLTKNDAKNLLQFLVSIINENNFEFTLELKDKISMMLLTRVVYEKQLKQNIVDIITNLKLGEHIINSMALIHYLPTPEKGKCFSISNFEEPSTNHALYKELESETYKTNESITEKKCMKIMNEVIADISLLIPKLDNENALSQFIKNTTIYNVKENYYVRDDVLSKINNFRCDCAKIIFNKILENTAPIVDINFLLNNLYFLVVHLNNIGTNFFIEYVTKYNLTLLPEHLELCFIHRSYKLFRFMLTRLNISSTNDMLTKACGHKLKTFVEYLLDEKIIPTDECMFALLDTQNDNSCERDHVGMRFIKRKGSSGNNDIVKYNTYDRYYTEFDNLTVDYVINIATHVLDYSNHIHYSYPKMHTFYGHEGKTHTCEYTISSIVALLLENGLVMTKEMVKKSIDNKVIIDNVHKYINLDKEIFDYCVLHEVIPMTFDKLSPDDEFIKRLISGEYLLLADFKKIIKNIQVVTPKMMQFVCKNKCSMKTLQILMNAGGIIDADCLINYANALKKNKTITTLLKMYKSQIDKQIITVIRNEQPKLETKKVKTIAIKKKKQIAKQYIEAVENSEDDEDID